MRLFALGLAAALLVLSSSRPSAQRPCLPLVTATSHGSSGYSSSGYSSSRVWVPGHHEFVYRRVWVPGTAARVWVEPVYETRRDSCGRTVRILLRAGGWRTVHEPGRYETRRVRVWQPGRWIARGYCS